MRISSLISAVENGVIAAAKSTGRQARRINRAVSIELAAGRIADGEQERLRLAERTNVEAVEITVRTNELLAKRSRTELANEIAKMRRQLALRVLQGAKYDEIEARTEEIDGLERLMATSPMSPELVAEVNAG